MLEAQIVSPRGSLYIAAEATRYDVQQLRSHVRSLYGPNPRDVQLSLRFGLDSRARIRDLVLALAAKFVGEGVRVTVNDALVPAGDGASCQAFRSATTRRGRPMRPLRSRVA